MIQLMNKKHKQAFTLIELLVVIAIISLLMAIIAPAMSRVRKSARRLCCAAQMQQIGIAIKTYAENQDHRIITACEMMYAHDANEALSTWFVRLLPYIDKKIERNNMLENTDPMWICPEDRDAYPKGFLNCPHEPMATYSPNGYYPQANAPDVPDNIRLGPAGGYKIEQVSRPSDCFLMGETSYASQFYDADADSVEVYNLPRDGHHRNTSGFYHNGWMNVLFVDGHIEKIKGEQDGQDVWPEGFETIYRTGRYMYWAGLTLPSANEKPAFWGPGY